MWYTLRTCMWYPKDMYVVYHKDMYVVYPTTYAYTLDTWCICHRWLVYQVVYQGGLSTKSVCYAPSLECEEM